MIFWRQFVSLDAQASLNSALSFTDTAISIDGLTSTAVIQHVSIWRKSTWLESIQILVLKV